MVKRQARSSSWPREILENRALPWSSRFRRGGAIHGTTEHPNRITMRNSFDGHFGSLIGCPRSVGPHEPGLGVWRRTRHSPLAKRSYYPEVQFRPLECPHLSYIKFFWSQIISLIIDMRSDQAYYCERVPRHTL